MTQAAQTNVLIFVPSHGEVICVPTVLSIVGLLSTLAMNGVSALFNSFGSAGLSEMRNLAVTMWYDALPMCSHMLWVDSDMEFPGKLVIDMFNLNEPLVGTMYRKRFEEVDWVGSGFPAQWSDKISLRPNNFIEVAAVGMGVTLLRRDCIDTMLKVMPQLSDTRLSAGRQKQYGIKRIIRCFDRIDAPEGVLGDDISFCHRWRQCDGRIWAAIGHDVGHVGRKTYRGSFLREQLKRSETGEGL